MNDARQLRLGLVVPTRSVADGLRCLHRAPFSELDEFERIVVVVDGPLPDSIPPAGRAEIISGGATASGPSRCRNTGIRSLGGRCEVILFLDDDCMPLQGWAASHRRAFSDPSIVAAAGPTHFRSEPGALCRALAIYPGLLPFRWSECSGTLRWAPASNISARAEVASRCLFDEALKFGEDIEWCHRLRLSGDLVGVPAAPVLHDAWTGYVRTVWKLWHWGLWECPVGLFPGLPTVGRAVKTLSWPEHLLLFGIGVGFSFVTRNFVLATSLSIATVVYAVLGTLGLSGVDWTNGTTARLTTRDRALLVLLDFAYSAGSMVGRIRRLRNTRLLYTLDGLPEALLPSTATRVVAARRTHRRFLSRLFWIVTALGVTGGLVGGFGG